MSPDGDLVAYICDRSGVPRVEIVGTASDSPALPRTVSGPDQEAISVAWSPDGQWLTYLVSPAGSIRAELHAVRPDGSGRRLLAGDGALETVFAGTWTAVPGRYAFTVADGVGPDAAVWFVDVESGDLTPVPSSVGIGFCAVTSVSRDCTQVVVRCGPRGRRRLLLLDAVGSSTPIPLLQMDFPAGADVGEDGRFAADGRSVFLRTSAGRDRIVLGCVPLSADGRPGPDDGDRRARRGGRRVLCRQGRRFGSRRLERGRPEYLPDQGSRVRRVGQGSICRNRDARLVAAPRRQVDGGGGDRTGRTPLSGPPAAGWRVGPASARRPAERRPAGHGRDPRTSPLPIRRRPGTAGLALPAHRGIGCRSGGGVVPRRAGEPGAAGLLAAHAVPGGRGDHGVRAERPWFQRLRQRLHGATTVQPGRTLSRTCRRRSAS